MTRAEALSILNQFQSWNIEQKSVGLALRGSRQSIDDIYDARRRLILKARETLEGDGLGASNDKPD